MILQIDNELLRLLSTVYVINHRWAKLVGESWLGSMNWNPLIKGDLCAWSRCANKSMIDVFRALSLAKALRQIGPHAGDIVEFGCAYGGTSAYLAMLCNAKFPRRRTFIVDRFEGLPSPNPNFDSGYRMGQFRCNPCCVEKFLHAMGVANRTVIVQAEFRGVDQLFQSHSVALAHVDGDLYESTCEALDILRTASNQTALIVLDDFWDNSGGVRRAVCEFVPDGAIIILGPSGQALLKASQLIARRGTAAISLRLSLHWIRSLGFYRSFIESSVTDTPVPKQVYLHKFLSFIS